MNNLNTYDRWTLAEFADIYATECDFGAKVDAAFAKMVEAQIRREVQGNLEQWQAYLIVNSGSRHQEAIWQTYYR